LSVHVPNLREMRKHNFADATDKWFKFGNNLRIPLKLDSRSVATRGVFFTPDLQV